MEQKNALIGMIGELPEAKVSMLFNIAKMFISEEAEKTPAKWISTEEAAEALGVTSATVRNYIRTGRLQGRKVSARKQVVSDESVQNMRIAQTRF